MDTGSPIGGHSRPAPTLGFQCCQGRQSHNGPSLSSIEYPCVISRCSRGRHSPTSYGLSCLCVCLSSLGCRTWGPGPSGSAPHATRRRHNTARSPPCGNRPPPWPLPVPTLALPPQGLQPACCGAFTPGTAATQPRLRARVVGARRCCSGGHGRRGGAGQDPEAPWQAAPPRTVTTRIAALRYYYCYKSPALASVRWPPCHISRRLGGATVRTTGAGRCW